MCEGSHVRKRFLFLCNCNMTNPQMLKWITRNWKGIGCKRREKVIVESQGNLLEYITEREDQDINWEEWNGRELEIRTCCFSSAVSAVNYLKSRCVLQGMVYKFILHKGTRWLPGSLHCSSNHLRCKARIQCAKQKLTESFFLNVFQLFFFFFSPKVSPGQLTKKYSSCSTIFIDDSTVSQPNLRSTIKW